MTLEGLLKGGERRENLVYAVGSLNSLTRVFFPNDHIIP